MSSTRCGRVAAGLLGLCALCAVAVVSWHAATAEAHDPATPQSTHAKVFAVGWDGNWGGNRPNKDNVQGLEKQLDDWLADPAQHDITVDHVAQSTGDNNITVITVWYHNH